MEKWLRRQHAGVYERAKISQSGSSRKLVMKEAGSILMLKVSFFMENCITRQSTLYSSPISYKLF